MEDFNPNRYAVINEKIPVKSSCCGGLAVLGDGADSATTILIFPRQQRKFCPEPGTA